MRGFAILAAGCMAAILSSCGGGVMRPPEAAATKPIIGAAEARRLILQERGRLWKDPESIRDAKAGEPYACSQHLISPNGFPINAPASCVCVELNAKNSLGGYTGLRKTIAVFPETGGVEGEDGGLLGNDHCKILAAFPELGRRTGL